MNVIESMDTERDEREAAAGIVMLKTYAADKLRELDLSLLFGSPGEPATFTATQGRQYPGEYLFWQSGHGCLDICYLFGEDGKVCGKETFVDGDRTDGRMMRDVIDDEVLEYAFFQLPPYERSVLLGGFNLLSNFELEGTEDMSFRRLGEIWREETYLDGRLASVEFDKLFRGRRSGRVHRAGLFVLFSKDSECKQAYSWETARLGTKSTA
jgi:hypothetical protein